MAFDAKVYVVLKDKDVVLLSKVGPATALVAMPTFDAATGEQVGAVQEQFNLQSIDDEIARVKALQAKADADFNEHLSALQSLRADVAAALA